MDISTQVQQCELDSHADTCCLGNGYQILYKTGKVDVGSFLEQLGELIKMKIVTVALAHNQPEMGQVYLLIFHQVLLIEGMQRHLLNPNQIREASHIINETPLKYLPTEERVPMAHSLVTEGNLCHIPFQLDGIISFFKTRKPTDQELETLDTTFCIDMTNATPTWSPNDSMYTIDERQLRREMANEDVRTRANHQVVTSISRATMYDL